MSVRIKSLFAFLAGISFIYCILVLKTKHFPKRRSLSLRNMLGKRSCPRRPTKTVGDVDIDFDPAEFDILENEINYLEYGGEFYPDCRTRHDVAIVIPYRQRESQLKLFLRHIHPILQRQDIHYRVFVVNQVGNNTFNRAMLMNVGFAEAMKTFNWNCFIFHDVDLIPETDRILYNCDYAPIHLSAYVNTFDYLLPYFRIFGGVSGLTTQQFKQINGFSNQFWGWGGEDDDLEMRVSEIAKWKISRYPQNTFRYRMVKHERESTNEKNSKRLNYLTNSSFANANIDGISNLRYDLENLHFNYLYTNVSVWIKPIEIKNETSAEME